MNILQSLFARSPFSPLQTHMEKVAECVEKLNELYQAHLDSDFKRLKKIANEISELEHSADITKNEIRSDLPKGLFLAVNRADLLEILSIQDTIADRAEDLGVIVTLKKLEPLTEIKDELKQFLDKNIEAVRHAHNIIREMDELLQTAFSGKEAEKVRKMVETAALMEHEADVLQRELLKKLFAMEDSLAYTSFFLWVNALEIVASLGNLAEKLAYRVLMLLEVNNK